MALADFAEPLGRCPSWSDALWPPFRAMVLDVLVRAYEQLVSDALHTRDWDENQFSASMLIRIWRIRDAESLPFVPHDEARIMSEGVLNGTADADESPRMDLCVRHLGMRRELYLGIEAKVLTAVTIGTRRPAASVEAYVEKGMRRFTDGRYSAALPFAAMIAFVLAGPSDDLAVKIAAQVVASGLPCIKPIAKVSVAAVHPQHYASVHPGAIATAPNLEMDHLLFEV